MPDQHGRTLGKRTVAAVAIDAGPQGGAATEESVTIGNGLYLLGRIGGSGVSFLVDTGSGVSILAARKWKEWGRTEDELTRYWGRLCSVEGRALECLGKARLTVTLGTRVVEWGFIVAEIGDDEGILGNDFAMAHELTVRPCEGAVYLPDHTETGRGHLGERLPCTVRVVTEVRTITEETLAVRAVGPATLAPHAITQVRVIVPTPWACGTVMVDRGPGPLGLCPVRGIVEVEQASNIWLANPGSRPIQLDGDEVVALAECVLAGPGASAGSDRDIGDEVNGLVERASPHLTREECRQLQMAMAARKHLFAKGKGDLGRTDIVQHRIHTGDQPAIKQRVRRYPAARREEERQLVEDMLAIGIIQESNSAWSSPTVLVKKKDGTTRFCIDYRRLNQATKVDAYPLPHIEDSLNTLGGARFFCSLDLASGYWQVEMDAADREKTAFVTQGGLYEFRVMPFGLVNAPATFERLMERVLRGIAWSECLVYLDDILVFGPDFGTTLARLEKVLDRLGEAGLKLKAKKCQLFQEEIPFRWEDISPESRETKVLWRQWERLYLVRGVLHRQFHELEGQGWRPQLVVPADRRGSLLQRFHGGMIGAHLGTTRTMVLAEQGFYWPGMRADVSRICDECDCAMLKRRRGRREPLHQYVVGVPMERLAMDVAGPYPVTSAGNQYCLMVGCYFSKWLECFPIPDQKATTVARKLVFEIVARYGAFRELHSDQGTNFGSKVVLEVCRLFGIHRTRTTPYHPRSDGFIERSFRTLGRCLKAACRETKQEWDELVPLILMSYRATPQASTGVTPNMMMLGRQTRLPVQAMYGAPLGPEEEASTVSEYVAALQGGLRAAYRHARAGLQRAALHQKHDYDSKVQRREYQAGELVWIHDITLERTRGTKLQFPWFGPALITKVLDRGRVVVRRKRDKPLAVMHVDRLETYRGTAVPAWMTTEQRECVAV